jgi:hypothetical protein
MKKVNLKHNVITQIEMCQSMNLECCECSQKYNCEYYTRDRSDWTTDPTYNYMEEDY